MRILMLGNSLTFANDMPHMLAALTGAEVVHHTRGGARLSEQLNPATRLGAQTQAALAGEHWDYVVLQEIDVYKRQQQTVAGRADTRRGGSGSEIHPHLPAVLLVPAAS